MAKNTIFVKYPLKKCWKKAFGALYMILAILLTNIIVKPMAPLFQNTLIFNPEIIN